MKIKAHASLQTQRDRITTEFEVTKDEIKNMNEAQKQEYIDKLVFDWAESNLSFGWEEV